MNNEQVQEIFVEDIIPNRFQPRLTFDEKTLQELSDSIKEHGIIQPIVLRRLGNKYEIIAGERRYKAACLAGLKKVPAIVKEMSDNESAEVALIENIQRKNLTSIEEAQSYKNLLDRGYLTQEALAQKLGISQSAIANKLRLLNLCDEVQNALLNEQISERHARSLLQLEKFDDQRAMLKRIIDERLTVKKLDDEIRKLLNGESSNEGDAKNMDSETRKNIFGLSIEPPTDMEATPPNLSVGQEETIPVSFNPFSQSNSSINVFTESSQNPNQTTMPNSEFGNVVDNNFAGAPISSFDEPIETFDLFGDTITDSTTINNNVSQNAEVPSKSIGEEINSIRNTVKEVEASGFKVEMEEYDFEDMYQIVLKIKK